MNRDYLRMLLLTLAALIGGSISSLGGHAQEFTIIRCNDTKKDLAVQIQPSSYTVHFHLQVKNFSSDQFFVNLRTTYGSETDRVETVSTIVAQTKSADETWTVYLQALRFTKRDIQNAAMYQIEFGPYRPAQLNEFEIANSFAWKLNESSQGVREVHHGESIDIPTRIRTYKIEGGEPVFASRLVERCDECLGSPFEQSSPQIGFSNTSIRIAGENMIRRIRPSS